MERSTQLVIGVAVFLLAALTAFALYRWRQRDRARRVEAWVGAYLSDRFGRLPDALSVNCSDDRWWPVLVAFDHPGTGIRHRLQFTCYGPPATFAILAEKDG